ncbi:Polyketide cyclase dehydrase [Pyrenophora seminiperda CCB06]|uniref:Polyketide cyclase dehydrase n=1 Tax=Pyrenophora seminiperda CCB06 TaxID=1302712 RepID=A0A3M7M915_9PLEO|nr:Polyketide cyclase dehydrase [Pyrenophora seminiperda CCB06]
MSSNTVAWPPAEGLTTKLVPRTHAVLQLAHSTIIHAPAPLVFDALLNVAEYAKWNTFIPSVRIVSQPPTRSPESPNNKDNERDRTHLRLGTTMIFDAVMDASKPTATTPSSLRIADISTPTSPSSYLSPSLLADPSFTADLSKVYRVSWVGNGGMMYALGAVMKVQRFHEVIVRGDAECEVRTWELMGGVLAYLVKMSFGAGLQGKFVTWCEELKAWCEKVYKEGDGEGAAGGGE